ncbi:MAG: M4 family metallopeptidase, partial [Psychrosphaera sp.]|nr:M4 family metallopeptidase [Psychrosphaera sp.]
MKARNPMKALNPIAASIAVILGTSSMSVLAGNAAVVQNQSAIVAPSLVAGQFGSATAQTTVWALKNIVASHEEYQANGNEDFTITSQWTDELGMRHTRVNQKINGLKVYGSSMVVHNEAVASNNGFTNVQAQSKIVSVSGVLAVNNDSVMSMLSVQASGKQATKAISIGNNIGEVHGDAAELSYVYVSEEVGTKLAWRMEVSWDNGNGDVGRDFVFVDANTAEVVARHAQVHSALSRKTYTLNGGGMNSVPGTLVCTDNQSCGNDAPAQRAHDGAADVYNYYKDVHGRDSLDNAGFTLISSVDLGQENAFWNGSQMIYGRAGTNVDNDFTSDLDVIGHEFTHGLTNKTANLKYENASGALNEAWSDIMGLTIEARKANSSTSSWLLGDGLYNTPGKA